MPEVSFLSDVLIFLVAAVIVAPIFQRLRSSLVLGFLVAGFLIGPHGLALIDSSATTRGLADLGVIFLLFTIGLELNIERLRVIRSYIFGLGGAQVIITGGAIGLAAGFAGLNLESAILIGGGLALSSTAVVLQLLSERGELASRVGRTSLAILLLQDLAVVPLLALVPSLSGAQEELVLTVLWTLVKGVIGVAAIFAVGRLVLRPLFRAIAIGRSPELFAAMTLLVLLGTSWATAQLGLSMAIGGFLAGLLLAETEYRHQVAAEIAPFRGLLLGLFFMTVGMAIDLRFAAARLDVVLAIAAVLIFGKSLIIAGLARLAGHSAGSAIHVGLLLAQGGEFAFIMFGLAMTVGVLAPDIANVLMVGVALSMCATPLLAGLGRRINDRLEALAAGTVEDIGEEADDLTDHVIVLGFGRVGQAVAQTLAAAEIAYVAIEYETTRVTEARAKSLPVFYGDATRPEMLRAVGAGRARAAVVTMDDPAAAERAVHLLNQHHPHLHIFVRARDSGHRRRLEAAGATGIVHETFEMSLQLGGSVLRRLGTPDERVQEIITEHRADDYARLSDILLPAAAAAEAVPAESGDEDTNPPD